MDQALPGHLNTSPMKTRLKVQFLLNNIWLSWLSCTFRTKIKHP